jgi:hypothetical protein
VDAGMRELWQTGYMHNLADHCLVSGKASPHSVANGRGVGFGTRSLTATLRRTIAGFCHSRSVDRRCQNAGWGRRRARQVLSLTDRRALLSTRRGSCGLSETEKSAAY